MKTSRVYTLAFFAVIFLVALASCSARLSGSKTVTKTSAYPGTLERAMKNKRYFIMQSGINLYTVTSLDVDKSKQQMTVTLDKVDSLHLGYFKNPAVRPDKTNEAQLLQPEIHVFMKDSTSYTLDEPHTIPLEKVARIELFD